MLDVEWDVLHRRVAARTRVCERLTTRDVVDVELESGGQRIRTTAACFIIFIFLVDLASCDCVPASFRVF